MIELRSDNAAGAAPEIVQAVADANVGSQLAYGGDEYSEALTQLVRDVFEHPTAVVYPVASGTAANALSLAAMCPPWGSVLGHETAHIIVNECGATSGLSGGAVMRPLGGADFRVQPATLQQALDTTRWGDNHQSQPSVLSITQPTDFGTLYSPDELTLLAGIAHAAGMRVHVDGARLANALVALGCSPAELTWRAGVDVMSLGAIKNGGLSCDAIVVFDDDESLRQEFHYRTKRAGHVSSKMRFQSAQLLAYLTDGLWLRLASNANVQMAALAGGIRGHGVTFLAEPQVNMLWLALDDETVEALRIAGAEFYEMGAGRYRFVTSWQTTTDEVATVIDVIGTATRSS